MSIPTVTPVVTSEVFNPSSAAYTNILARIFSNVAVPILAWAAGLITLGIILYGGYQYMSAQGDTKKVAEAKKTIFGGIIGLVIVISAYSIVNIAFAISNGINTGSVTPRSRAPIDLGSPEDPLR